MNRSVRTFLWAALVALAAAGAGAGGTPPDDLVSLGKRVQKRVVDLRGLSIRKPIRWELTDRASVRNYLLEILDKQYAPGELEREG